MIDLNEGRIECPECGSLEPTKYSGRWWDEFAEIYRYDMVCRECGLMWSEIEDNDAFNS